MNINLNFQPAFRTNTLFNTFGLNQSIANKQTVGADNLAEEERRDTLILSPGGGRQNLLNNLMKLKTEITERKNELMGTLKDGATMDSIKGQLDFYDEQLENIDEQIAEAMTKEMEEKGEKEEQKKENEPLTREEFLNKKMTDLTELSGSISRVQIMDSAKSAIDGRIKVLKSEIELDKKLRSGTDLDGGAADYKMEQLAELEKRSKDLSSEIGKSLIQIAEDAAENNKPSAITHEKETDSSEETKNTISPDNEEDNE